MKILFASVYLAFGLIAALGFITDSEYNFADVTSYRENIFLGAVIGSTGPLGALMVGIVQQHNGYQYGLDAKPNPCRKLGTCL